MCTNILFNQIAKYELVYLFLLQRKVFLLSFIRGKLGELEYNNMKGAFFSVLASTFSAGDVDTFACADHSSKYWKEMAREWEKHSLLCY